MEFGNDVLSRCSETHYCSKRGNVGTRNGWYTKTSRSLQFLGKTKRYLDAGREETVWKDADLKPDLEVPPDTELPPLTALSGLFSVLEDASTAP